MTAPSRMPFLISKSLERRPSIFTRINVLEKMFLMYLNMRPRKPSCRNLMNKPTLHTRSKAFWKSINTATKCCETAKIFVVKLFKKAMWSSVDIPRRKPAWPFDSILFFSKNQTRRVSTIFSKILERQLESAIGLGL